MATSFSFLFCFYQIPKQCLAKKHFFNLSNGGWKFPHFQYVCVVNVRAKMVKLLMQQHASSYLHKKKVIARIKKWKVNVKRDMFGWQVYVFKNVDVLFVLCYVNKVIYYYKAVIWIFLVHLSFSTFLLSHTEATEVWKNKTWIEK